MPNSKINIQEEITKIGLNRKQRRQISKNTSKNLQENMGKLEIETLTKQVPVTASVARLTRKYLAGKVNSDTLKAALADSFSDITLFLISMKHTGMKQAAHRAGFAYRAKY